MLGPVGALLLVTQVARVCSIQENYLQHLGFSGLVNAAPGTDRSCVCIKVLERLHQASASLWLPLAA